MVNLTKNNGSNRLGKTNWLFRVSISAANVILLIAGNAASSQAKELDHSLSLAVASQIVSQQFFSNRQGSGNSNFANSFTLEELKTIKLELEVKKLKIENANSQRNLGNFFYTNASVILAIILGFVGLIRYINERREATRQQEDARFQEIVKSLGVGIEQERIGAAVLLLGFLRPQYKRFHIQVFNLAAGNLRIHLLSNNDNKINHSAIVQPLGTALQQAYPLAREALKKSKEFQKEFKKANDKMSYLIDFMKRYLSAAGIQLDGFNLNNANLEHAYLQSASFVKATFHNTHLSHADLSGSNMTEADLESAELINATLKNTIFKDAILKGTDMRGALLIAADFTDADLTGANLTGSIFGNKGGEKEREANPEAAKTLEGAKFYDVKGLTKGQILRCKEKGAQFSENVEVEMMFPD